VLHKKEEDFVELLYICVNVTGILASQASHHHHLSHSADRGHPQEVTNQSKLCNYTEKISTL